MSLLFECVCHGFYYLWDIKKEIISKVKYENDYIYYIQHGWTCVITTLFNFIYYYNNNIELDKKIDVENTINIITSKVFEKFKEL